MTKRIVSGIFILTALGALGVILAGALTSGEQLIVRFLTAVIVAALGLYVISDLRLQADDDAMTARTGGHPRLATVDAPPNSTAAFMATVTKKTEVRPSEADFDGESLELIESKGLLETTVVAESDQSVFAGGAGSTPDPEPSEAPRAVVENAVSHNDLGLVGRRSAAPAPKPAPQTMRAAGPMARVETKITDLFGRQLPPAPTPENTVDGYDGNGATESVEDSPEEQKTDVAALADVAADVDSVESADAPVKPERAEVAELVPAIAGSVPASISLDAISEFKPWEPVTNSTEQNGSRPGSPFEQGTTSAKISFSKDPAGENVSFGNGNANNPSSQSQNGGGANDDVTGDQPAGANGSSFNGNTGANDDGNVNGNGSAHSNGSSNGSAHSNPSAHSNGAAHDSGSQEPVENTTTAAAAAAEEAQEPVSDFEYSDELQSPEHAWPAPPAKKNGVHKPHPFEKAAAEKNGHDRQLNGNHTKLPVPTSSGNGLLAADYADAPLAPIIDLREVNGQNSENVDTAINAGEVEVIATLIEQGMLSTEGPISDRDVRTMVYVAFTSNELRKLLIAGGTPDGPNHGLDLGPVELFDERIHAPAPKTLYSGIDRPEPQSQIG